MKIATEERHGGHFRVLKIKGDGVSHLGIYDHVVRIGPAQFKMGGIGGVATNWKHRKKGYARLVMEDSMNWMRDEGYDVTLLFGIEHFYHKFGFANCMPECVATVRTRDAEAMLGTKRTLEVRAAKDSDWPNAVRLYNRNNARRPLSIVRKARGFKGLRHGSGFHKRGEWVVLETRSGRFAGYAILDALPEPTRTCEVEVTNPAAYADVLGHLVRTAIRRRDGEIAVQLPLDHPFISHLRRFGCVVTVTYKNTGAMVGRFVNQDAVLTRLAAACGDDRGLRRAHGKYVRIKTDLGETRVAFAGAPRGGVARLVIPATTLFQVVVGFRKAEEALLSPGVRASGGGERLLEFLCPAVEPYLYSIDHF